MPNRNPLCGKLAALAIGFLLAASAAAADRGPSTPEERAKALELVDLLEKNPSAPEAKPARAWLTLWLVEVPDLTVSLCPDLLGTPEELAAVPPELAIHQAYAQAAFLIENPKAKARSPATYAAGIEGTLRAYDSMRAAATVDEIPALEELRRKQAGGELEKLVKKRSRTCK